MVLEVFITIIGIVLVTFPEHAAKNLVNWQKDNFGSRADKKRIKIGKVTNRLLGVVFIIVGLSGLLG